jgi:DNA modification methylase
VNSSESSGSRPTTANKPQAQAASERASAGSPRRAARAELIWEGKYDAHGRRVAPLRVALPFQTVETVNESAQERQRGFMFGPGFREEEWRNRLIWGDKKYVLPSLLAEFAGKVNLIYIDPPFDTGQDFSFTASVPDDPDTTEDNPFAFTKQPSMIEQKAYRDTWGKGLDSYLQWMYETITLLRELLAENGSIYVHMDVHRGPYVKLLMDEIFGIDNFRNEIAWYYYNKMHDSRKKRLPKAFDQILCYVKNRNADFTYKAIYEERDEPVRQLKRVKVEGKMINARDDDGNIMYQEKTTRTVDTVWRIRCLQPANKQEWVDYDTQKPVDLLERILLISSSENDLVLDCFCGSGTTFIAAERMNRRWIGGDLGRFAIHVTRKRLLSTNGLRPFVVQNLGKYERQLWAGAQFGENNGDQAAAQQRAYIDFILKLAGATPLNGYSWLHGVRGGRMVHVGAVDAPVSVGDVTQIAAEFRRAIGTGKDAPKTNGVDVLGWDFAFELNEVAKQQAAAANIQMRFLRIPRDVMDKRAVEQGDIRFFELAALSVDVETHKRNVFLKLKDFVIPPDDVPEEARRAVKHWSQWIDYWAVDWDNKSDTFHNEWQTYRTRRDNTLALEISHTYADVGDYTIVVKVIDILGNDTTKTVKVKVT